MSENKSLMHRIFRDKEGHLVLFQAPNLPILIWVILEIISLFLKDSKVKSGIDDLANASIFTWAYLEITDGATLFRRALGSIVIIVVIIGFFK